MNGDVFKHTGTPGGYDEKVREAKEAREDHLRELGLEDRLLEGAEVIGELRLNVLGDSDEELSCIICGRDHGPCELTVDVPAPGRRSWWGLHQACWDYVLERAARKKEKEDIRTPSMPAGGWFIMDVLSAVQTWCIARKITLTDEEIAELTTAVRRTCDFATNEVKAFLARKK